MGFYWFDILAPLEDYRQDKRTTNLKNNMPDLKQTFL